MEEREVVEGRGGKGKWEGGFGGRKQGEGRAKCVAGKLTRTGRDDLLSPDGAFAGAAVVAVALEEAPVDRVPFDAVAEVIGAPGPAAPDAVAIGSDASVVAAAAASPQ